MFRDVSISSQQSKSILDSPSQWNRNVLLLSLADGYLKLQLWLCFQKSLIFCAYPVNSQDNQQMAYQEQKETLHFPSSSLPFRLVLSCPISHISLDGWALVGVTFRCRDVCMPFGHGCQYFRDSWQQKAAKWCQSEQWEPRTTTMIAIQFNFSRIKIPQPPSTGQTHSLITFPKSICIPRMCALPGSTRTAFRHARRPWGPFQVSS